MTKTTALILRTSLLTMTLLAAASCFLLPSEPFPDSDRLVVLREVGPDGAPLAVTRDALLAWRDEAAGFESVSAHVMATLPPSAEDPHGASTVHCTIDLFQTLGVQPWLGRSFIDGDEAHHVALLSHELWQDLLAGSPNAVGGQIRLGEVDHIVLGIMPKGIPYPHPAELWRPLILSDIQDDAHELTVTARLAPGVSPEQMEASLNGTVLRCGHGVSVIPLLDVLARGG
jgi:hypothetical protein